MKKFKNLMIQMINCLEMYNQKSKEKKMKRKTVYKK